MCLITLFDPAIIVYLCLREVDTVMKLLGTSRKIFLIVKNFTYRCTKHEAKSHIPTELQIQKNPHINVLRTKIKPKIP